MRTVNFRPFAMAIAAFLSVVGSVAAEEKQKGLLNSLEVQQLVAHAEPADNVRLAVHFTALADRYDDEARQHVSMSKNFVANPSRNLGTGMSAHCRQLADLNTQSATIARELAAYHGKLANGMAATPPRDASLFEAGKGAPGPTEKELNVLAVKANLPADHGALEEYFRALARRYQTDAREHTALALAYRGTRIGQAATLHDQLARMLQDAVKEASAAAEMHKQFATGR